MATPDHPDSHTDGAKASATNVNFVCQKCYQPLKLDSSFENIDKRLYTDLTSPITAVPQDDDHTEETSHVSNYDQNDSVARR